MHLKNILQYCHQVFYGKYLPYGLIFLILGICCFAHMNHVFFLLPEQNYFVFFMKYVCKNICKNAILKRHLLLYLLFFLHLSQSCIGLLKIMKKLVLEVLTFLESYNEIILIGQILNNCEARLSKLLLYFELSYELADVHL